MKSIIKKTHKALKIATIASIVSATLVATPIVYANIKYADYNSNAEINEIAQMLDCDTDYLKTYFNQYCRMEHNGDEPIYVYIDDDYTQDEKQAVKQSLERIFGIIGIINSKYKYKIVDYGEFNSIKGKTKIKYTLKHDKQFVVDDAMAQVEHNNNLLSLLTNKKLMNNFVIRIDREQIAKSPFENQLDKSLDHELAHAFSLKDSYYIHNREAVWDNSLNNTYMHYITEQNIGMFTPNDIKCWISVYADSKQKAEDLLPFLNEYTENYYDVYSKQCLKKCEKLNDFNLRNFEFESIIEIKYENGEKHGYKYNLIVENGKYKFLIYDKNTLSLMDDCSGEALYLNGVVVLKELKLTKGLMPNNIYYSFEEGVTQDLIVGCFKDGFKGKTIAIYDLQTDLNYFGDILELEKTIEQ